MLEFANFVKLVVVGRVLVRGVVCLFLERMAEAAAAKKVEEGVDAYLKADRNGVRLQGVLVAALMSHGVSDGHARSEGCVHRSTSPGVGFGTPSLGIHCKGPYVKVYTIRNCCTEYTP